YTRSCTALSLLCRSLLQHTSIFFRLQQPPPPRSTLFPYTTLFRSLQFVESQSDDADEEQKIGSSSSDKADGVSPYGCAACRHPRSEEHTSESSHGSISYAVFCLKKKKKHIDTCGPAVP